MKENIMTKYFNIIKKVALFDKLTDGETEEVLLGIGARVQKCVKSTYILMAGDKPRHIGIVLSGSAHIIKETADGDRIIVAALAAGDYFAEALVTADVAESPVSVVAAESSDILLLEYKRLFDESPGRVIYRAKLVENLLKLISRKNLHLQNRLDIIGKKTLRHKLLAYLRSFKPSEGGYITVPLNREELADFLCADRSALSHELSRMKERGEIDYNKNRFKINNH